MSWTPEACVVAGYKIPREAQEYIYERIEENYDVAGKYEDFIIDSNGPHGIDDLFFGKIILKITEDSQPVRFDNIFFTQKDIDEVNQGFNLLLSKWCAEHNYSLRFDKWIIVRWI